MSFPATGTGVDCRKVAGKAIFFPRDSVKEKPLALKRKRTMNIKHVILRIARTVTALTAAALLPGSVAAQALNAEITKDHPRVKQVMSVQKELTTGLMSMPEILGTAVGQDDDGEIT